MIGAILSKAVPWLKWWPLLACLATAYATWTVWAWKDAADERDELVAALNQRTEREAKMQVRAEAAEDTLATISNQNRAVKWKEAHETRADAYRCPLPANGVRILDEAHTGVAVVPTGEPDGKMP